MGNFILIFVAYTVINVVQRALLSSVLVCSVELDLSAVPSTIRAFKFRVNISPSSTHHVRLSCNWSISTHRPWSPPPVHASTFLTMASDRFLFCRKCRVLDPKENEFNLVVVKSRRDGHARRESVQRCTRAKSRRETCSAVVGSALRTILSRTWSTTAVCTRMIVVPSA